MSDVFSLVIADLLKLGRYQCRFISYSTHSDPFQEEVAGRHYSPSMDFMTMFNTFGMLCRYSRLMHTAVTYQHESLLERALSISYMLKQRMS